MTVRRGAKMSDEIKFWFEESARISDTKVVVKLKNQDMSFRKSVIIPTVYYPLNGEVCTFSAQNTKQVEDKAVLDIFDSVPYKIGFCYQNTQKLVQKLRAAGYNAVPYVGWLFTAVTDFPVHHCWCVLNGESVLDLSDDFTVMLSGTNGEHFINKSKDEIQEAIVSFATEARKRKNSMRCAVVGTPTPFLLYVGSPCEPEEGRLIYQRLIAANPNHECERNCDSSGYNATQRKMKDAGLMD